MVQKTHIKEVDVEQHLVKEVKRRGGVCEKFASPGKAYVPDRIVTMPGGHIWFVELKAPGKKPTAGQLRDHERRRALGFKVLVLDSIAAVNIFLYTEVENCEAKF